MNSNLWTLGTAFFFVILIVCPVAYQLYHAILRIFRGEGL